jgi:hypothetical protein
MRTLIAQHHHPHVRELYAYWDGKCRGRRMPSRADVDPTELTGLLPYLLLVDVEHDPLRFRCRLAGTAVHALREGQAIRELTGRYMDEVDVEASGMPAMTLIPPDVVATREPMVAETRYVHHGSKTGHFWNLILPLSNDDHVVHMILVGHFLAEPYRLVAVGEKTTWPMSISPPPVRLKDGG